MKDIVKEIIDADVGGVFNEKERYFRKETTISREYFNNEVIKRYPNLEFIRILMNKTTIIPSFHESMRDEEYYLYSVFIDKSILQYISSDNLVRTLNGENVIDLSKFRWGRQVELRNKILIGCPIIMSECYYFYDYSESRLSDMNVGLSKNIAIYPYSFEIEGYELLNSTNFILISNLALLG